MSFEIQHWPPPYTLSHKSHIRSVRLRICAQRGLLLTVPKRFDAKNAAAVLEEHRAWIEKTWRRIQPHVHASEQSSYPQQLNLLAINETWQVIYSGAGLNPLTQDAALPLVIRGDLQNYDQIKKIFDRWLRKYAQKRLLPWLQRLSEQMSLLYASTTIRKSSTRWGSCSAQKRISLDPKLLFLPPHLVEYVLIHELCHLKHLNHSRDFWNLVQQFCPNYALMRKELHKAHFYIPALFCR